MAALGDAQVRAAAEQWVKWDPCSETKDAVSGMLSRSDSAALRAAFGSRVEFGTAGLRAEVGPGTSRLNDLVIIQTAQGLCLYAEQALGAAAAKKRGIVLGFDHRARGALNSKRFALLTAAVFLSRGHKVLLFGAYVPTPFVPFAVKKYGAACGVMVTASHNPKNDNGFKVYWANACQIIPPHDELIAASIERALAPWPGDLYAGASQEAAVRASKLCSDPQAVVARAYFAEVAGKLCRHKRENGDEGARVDVCYTAMHGIGHAWACEAFAAFGLRPFVPTAAQVEPDAAFPTVAFPNPEEGKGALQLAMAAAEAAGCRLILANDPDAARLAAAERGAAGQWKVFSGNEIAALLGHWEWTRYAAASGERRATRGGGAKNKQARPSRGAAMVASTVSSKFLRAMAAAEGFHFEECLTGFKWIGNKSLELRAEGYDVIFAFEEAIGFCLGDVVPDKDGISALAVFAEMAGQLRKAGKSCLEHLAEIQNKYGHFVSNNGYVVSHDTQLNLAVFNAMRTSGPGGRYRDACGPDKKFKITHVRDLLSPGHDSSKPDGKPTLPVAPASHMLTFTFANGAVATLRMSGTEPKLKYYTEMSGSDPAKVEEELKQLVEQGIRGDLLGRLVNK